MIKCCIRLFVVWLLGVSIVYSSAIEVAKDAPPALELPKTGSWTFSGLVSNEAGERYGYFFQMQKQGRHFHSKTALIDGQTNKLVFYYEGNEDITPDNNLNWQVGRSYIKYNLITDSWVFGVKSPDKKGFNFKVDMLKLVNSDIDTLALRPGIKLQTLQTSRLTGHIKVDDNANDEFVTSNKSWFGKLWFLNDENSNHEIKTTFCRLADDKSFYSAYLEEEDATSGFVTGFRNEVGQRVKSSQFVSIKSLNDDQFLLNLSWPKMHMTLANTLSGQEKNDLMAGFSKDRYKDFCFVTAQSFEKTSDTVTS